MKKLISSLLVRSLLFTGSLASLGCGSKEEEESLPTVDCETTPVPRYPSVTAFVVCGECHSSTLKTPMARSSAPVGENFDTYAGAVNHATEIVEEVYEGKMPPASSTQLTETQKQQLYQWALCGTPQ